MENILQFAVNALSLGGVYAMLASGIALIYSVMGFLNIAHGDLLTLCGYAMFFCIGFGLPWPLVIIVGVLAAGAASVAMEWPVAEVSASGLFLHRACTASAGLKLSLWRSTELLNSA